MVESRPAGDISRVFVGRQQELVVLEAALDVALTGHGRIVMLAGEPGIGKSRIPMTISSAGKFTNAPTNAPIPNMISPKASNNPMMVAMSMHTPHGGKSARQRGFHPPATDSNPAALRGWTHGWTAFQEGRRVVERGQRSFPAPEPSLPGPERSG